MKISPNIIKPIPIKKHTNNNKTTVHYNINELSYNEEKTYFYPLSFGKKKQSPYYKERLASLKGRDIETFYAQRLANLPDEQYQKANELLEKKVKIECIEELTGLKPINYAQALELVEQGIFDFHIHALASLDKEEFQQAKDLLDKNIDSDSINLLVGLTPEEFKEAEKLMKEGHPPIIAGYLCKLSPEERAIALDFIEQGADIETAYDLSKLSEEARKKCSKLLQEGFAIEFVGEIAELNSEQEKRIPELKSLKVSDSTLTEIATLGKKDYKKAIEMIKAGVNEEYISFILEIESGKRKNKDYQCYRDRNYSRTTSFSLTLLSEQEIEALEKVREKNPIIRNLMQDEYEINVIKLQNEETNEAIFTKRFITEYGTKITINRTFDEYGEETVSRVEEYKDNHTSSIMSGRSGTFIAKYDQNGEIKELTEYIQDEKTNSVVGVIHSKASDIISGVYDSVYYDISQFKTGFDIESIDETIENSTIGQGEVISSTQKDDDGTITYTEQIEINDSLIDREYKEKKDGFGNIIFSSYKYKIQSENDPNPMLDLERIYIRNNDNHITNAINGITYEMFFDDENKIIEITDGENTREINAKNILPYYSGEIIWKQIKKLQVDTIIDVFDNIKKWNYCNDIDSVSNACNCSISTGQNQSIILHEIGHILACKDPSILESDDFAQIYGTEMQNFQISLPYNEQKFVQYFSPRANLIGSDGADEFIAETNLLLTTFGTSNAKIKTRTQFLEKYFPKTIAFIANYLGKNSKESLLK